MFGLGGPLVFPLGGTGLFSSTDPVLVEIRVGFPGPLNMIMTPTELSGAIFTLRANGLDQSQRMQLWYEKPLAASMTGNVYLTSSAGRLQLTSASIFDDNFYNL